MFLRMVGEGLEVETKNGI